jgi:hypothetical protein
LLSTSLWWSMMSISHSTTRRHTMFFTWRTVSMSFSTSLSSELIPPSPNVLTSCWSYRQAEKSSSVLSAILMRWSTTATLRWYF